MSTDIKKMTSDVTNKDETYHRICDEGETFMFNGMAVPSHTVYAIARYVAYGIIPGDFLSAVIENDLRKAMDHADMLNQKNIGAIVAFFYNRTPSCCWGHKGALKKWKQMISENK